MDRSRLTRFAWLSIAAALLTIGLKSLAYGLTGSVGLLSDAMESGVNLVAAIMALSMLTIAARPPDEEHAFGHSKAEYFSSGVEGALDPGGCRKHHLDGRRATAGASPPGGTGHRNCAIHGGHP